MAAPPRPRTFAQSQGSPSCGNGTLEPGEECDDGNTRNSDGCNQFCQFEQGVCGDGIVESGLGEQCDFGAVNGQEGVDCSVACKFPRLAQCGDGAWDPLTEECDAGALNGDYPDAPCRSNCALPRCGDAIVDPDRREECDAGNNLDGPDCFADCTLPRRAAETPVIVSGNQTPSPSGGEERTNSPVPILSLPVRSEVVPSSIPTPAKTATGPGLVIFLASGAAAGVGLVRRRLRGEP